MTLITVALALVTDMIKLTRHHHQHITSRIAIPLLGSRRPPAIGDDMTAARA